MGKRSLVVLAAGIGSRFGGLKQVEPVGPNGEVLTDYAVYDAMQAGFERVVFIIREEHLDIFKEKVVNKFMDKIEVCFAYQKLDNIPSDVKMPKGREKMWGTTHALLAAKEYIDDDFVMINADDFYGRDTYFKAKEFFDNNQKDHEYVVVSFPFIEVASKNGKVKRGVLELDNDLIKNINESEIEITENGNIAKSLIDGSVYTIPDNTPVSMNFLGFKKDVFELLESDFQEFIHGNIDLSCECLISETLKKAIQDGKVVVHNKVSSAKWFGITYREDLAVVQEEILKLIKDGVYKNNLWG